MSRPQTVRMAWQLGGLALGLVAFLLLPFGPVADFLVAATLWFIVGGIDERYFRRNAAPDDIRADLEDRKNMP